MNSYKFNEGKACDAVLRCLERREDAQRTELRSPERDLHEAPIELTCRIGARLFALEHTGIEPFEGHVRMEAQADRHFKPIEQLVAGKLPTSESFELLMPVNATATLRGGALRRMHEALADWIVRTAPGLEIARAGRYVTPIDPVKPLGVPFLVSLHRSEPLVGDVGRFQIRHSVGDVKPDRFSRLRKACRAKYPKLAWWRVHSDARTVLVLEENDIQLTNHHLVLEALQEAERHLVNKPDEVWLVSSATSQWFVHPLRVDDCTLYDLDDATSVTRFDPAALLDVTSLAELDDLAASSAS